MYRKSYLTNSGVSIGIHTGGISKMLKFYVKNPGDGLHISTLLTVRSCIIMYCTYMYVFSMNKILFKPMLLGKALLSKLSCTWTCLIMNPK